MTYYDRVNHPIDVLTLMSLGVPQKVCRIIFETLQKACHHIKTGFGRSKAIYGNEQIPVSEIGQGNDLRPTLWAIISTILFRMIESWALCSAFLCYDTCIGIFSWFCLCG